MQAKENKIKELSLFTGAGGGITGTALLGWAPVGYIEWSEYCQKVIRQRIEDGAIPRAPIFSDIRAFTSEGYADAYKGLVDVVTAGFPCQPFSTAGARKGEDDERNMWPSTADVIRRVRPKFAFLENVPGILTDKYIRRIFADLAEMGFDARWGVLGGHETGALPNGKRLWIVASSSDSIVMEGMDIQEYKVTYTQESLRREHSRAVRSMLSQDDYTRIKRNTDAVARGMERLKAVGNGQMGPVAAKAWRTLSS